MNYKTILLNGLWSQNPGLVQLLGLCPLLAISNTLENAVGLGLATIFVLILSNASISLIRSLVPDAIRLPVFVLIIAALTTCAELLVQALHYPLYQSLGIFLPLIVTNCLILSRAEALAGRESVWISTLDGAAQGVGFFLVLIALGGLRELLSSTLILAALPPGAFISLGLLVALHRALTEWVKNRHQTTNQNDHTERRVRTTGDIL
ncbi:electron transport complex subunit E [Litorivicinus sp.]|nr:electron transport complex subunit E [Litorivicinus sp.]MDC1208721.1 electron transport complex subunit E [Litorivicinus sp.]MDC1240066.1 electron transport complex subunit E [Litorivicinus sp.]